VTGTTTTGVIAAYGGDGLDNQAIFKNLTFNGGYSDAVSEVIGDWANQNWTGAVSFYGVGGSDFSVSGTYGATGAPWSIDNWTEDPGPTGAELEYYNTQNLNLTNAGTGYVTASGLATTTTSAAGSGMTLNITAVSGAVTQYMIVSPGNGLYLPGDTVTATQAGSGGNAVFTVAANFRNGYIGNCYGKSPMYVYYPAGMNIKITSGRWEENVCQVPIGNNDNGLIYFDGTGTNSYLSIENLTGYGVQAGPRHVLFSEPTYVGGSATNFQQIANVYLSYLTGSVKDRTSQILYGDNYSTEGLNRYTPYALGSQQCIGGQCQAHTSNSNLSSLGRGNLGDIQWKTNSGSFTPGGSTNGGAFKVIIAPTDGGACWTAANTWFSSVAMTSGSTTVTVNGLTELQFENLGLSVNDDISIAGAGVGGAALVTQVASINYSALTFTVATASSTSVSAAAVTAVPCTWAESNAPGLLGSGTPSSSTYLRGDGSWQTPPTVTSSTPGYAPASGGGTSNYLRADGTWATPGSTGVGASAPLNLQYLGTGADGAETCNGTLSGDFYYTTFSVPSGNTCSVNSGTGLTIHATGACTINGTLATTNSSITDASGGGSGGGGGGGAASGSTGAITYFTVGATGSSALAGGTAGTAGSTGGSGSTPSTNVARSIAISAPNDYLSTGGSAGGQGGSTGGAGGAGAAHIVLICASITGTGSITANGGNGTAAPGNSTGGGGGGGGGLIILSSQAAETYGLTLSVAGGSGGGCGAFTGCGAGGPGGTGFTAEFSGW
jgi:hypothetical protein